MALNKQNTLWVVMLSALLLSTMLAYAPSARAVVEAFDFKNEELRTRYQELATVLRCPKCQNQNIIDSDAGIADDLREQVYRLLEEGYTDDEILDFMVARYGNFVLYDPPVSPVTYLLWYGPFLLLGLTMLVVFLLLRGNRKAAKKSQQIDDTDRERLNSLLNRHPDKD